MAFGRRCPVGTEADEAHAGGAGGPAVGVGVADVEAAFGGDAEPTHAQLEHVGRGLGTLDHVGADNRVETEVRGAGPR